MEVIPKSWRLVCNINVSVDVSRLPLFFSLEDAITVLSIASEQTVMRYWFCITNPWNWFIVESATTWGVDDRYEITLKRVELDDIMVFYATNLSASLRKTLKQKLGYAGWKELLMKVATVEKTIVGIYRVVKTYFCNDSDLGWLDRDGAKPSRNLPHRIRITSIYPQPFRPIPLDFNTGRRLLEQLLFFPDKSKSYYNILYPSMLVIPEEDYLMIRRYVRAVNSTHGHVGGFSFQQYV